MAILEVTEKLSTEMATWSKRKCCVLSSCDIFPVLFLSLKFPLTTNEVIYFWIRCVLSSHNIVPVLFLYLKCPLTTGVVISCRICCVLSSCAIVPALFLSLKFPLATSVVISCHSYWCRFLILTISQITQIEL